MRRQKIYFPVVCAAMEERRDVRGQGDWREGVCCVHDSPPRLPYFIDPFANISCQPLLLLVHARVASQSACSTRNIDDVVIASLIG